MTDAARHGAIVVGNWFDDGWRPNSRLSIGAVARRWGVPVVELTRPVADADDGIRQKLWLDKHCAAFDRVVWLDRDVVVRYDCPNLFELVSAGNFGCVSAHQVPRHTREDARLLAPLFAENGVSFDHTVDHLNTGVMVFDPQRHAGVFGEARRFAVAARGLPYFDEPPISLAVKRSGRRQLLDSSFNRCGMANLADFSPTMTDYIWHFCGRKTDAVNAQIDATRWQLPPLPLWCPPVIAAGGAR